MRSNKIFAFSMSFLCAMGGLCSLFTSNAGIGSIAVLFALALGVLLLAFYAYDHIRISKLTKLVAAVLSFVSCTATVFVAGELLMTSKTLEGSYLPLVLLLGSVCAFLIAKSHKNAIKSISLVFALFVMLILLVTFVLCLLDTDFSAIRSDTVKLSALPLFSIFAVLDIFLILPICKTTSPLPFVFGVLSAFGITVSFLLIAISVLSFDVFRALDAPILVLWQSAYIASFINRFEIVSVCALYLACILKSAISLFCAVRILPEKVSAFAPLAVFACALCLSFL